MYICAGESGIVDSCHVISQMMPPKLMQNGKIYYGTNVVNKSYRGRAIVVRIPQRLKSATPSFCANGLCQMKSVLVLYHSVCV